MTNILLVEDNLGFRELIREHLVESNLKVRLIEANNPIEGLQLLTKHKYNFEFIICDFFLPIQNGTDFLDIAKSHNKSIKCLLISADEYLKNKSSPNIDKFFVKSDVESLIKYLQSNCLTAF
ncbi:MAG: response regulator [Bacteriovoracaceae bacterium]|nr:response regulator [Bacteriovoracaceae bacterium]